MMMNSEQFDSFLQQACMELNDIWGAFGGNEMGHHELMVLNDVLTQFFADKRETKNEQH